MATLCFKKLEVFAALGWAIEAYNKWLENDQPKCIDIKKLNLYLMSSSICTGKCCVILSCIMFILTNLS